MALRRLCIITFWSRQLEIGQYLARDKYSQVLLAWVRGVYKHQHDYLDEDSVTRGVT